MGGGACTTQSLGFDVVTYKTVRSSARECYPLPNLVPVDVPPMTGAEESVPAQTQMTGSWAVSFGMPSTEPDVWRADVERTRGRLAAGKILSVSVVGTVQSEMTLEELADDYARCAKWAVESGADVIETNFSCPNVSTRDGQLYQQPEAACLVAERVRAAIGQTPYVVKSRSRWEQESDAAVLLDAVGPLVDGLAMTNSIATRVLGRGSAAVRRTTARHLRSGDARGVGGADRDVSPAR